MYVVCLAYWDTSAQDDEFYFLPGDCIVFNDKGTCWCCFPGVVQFDSKLQECVCSAVGLYTCTQHIYSVF